MDGEKKDVNQFIVVINERGKIVKLYYAKKKK